MEDKTKEAIRLHASQVYPRESCGVVVICKGHELYVPCNNLAAVNGEDRFIMDSQDYAHAEELGEVVAIVHSHPNIAPTPSQADLVGCEHSGVPWVIVNWPTGNIYEFSPTGYKAPLIGRVFSYGTLDCYSLIRDYYQEVLNITIPDFDHLEEGWWRGSADLYLDNFAKAGFRKVDDLKEHDGILIQLASTKVNHAAVYIGDGKILHHVQRRLSSRDVYGGYWRKNTVMIVRHEALL